MIRATALLLLLAACDGTQSQQAFTPRPPSAYVVSVTTPNVAVARGRDLADSLERSLDEQEAVDRTPPVVMPDELAAMGAEGSQPRRHRHAAAVAFGADEPSPR